MGPRLAALVLGVLVAGGALGTALAQPPTPDFSFRVHFDQRGELEPASRPVVAAIKAAAPQVTDAFVFSHGWNNDPVTAERTYREFIDGMIAATPTARLPAGFKPLLVGIYWPSALFPVSNCLQPVGDRSQVHGWAQAAFPLVASRPGFEQEVTALHQAISQEQTSGPVGRAALLRSMEIVTEWSEAGDGGDPDAEADGEASILARSATSALQFYQDAVARNPEAARAGNLNGESVCGALNVFTFWTMKRRAGNVGARGGFDLVREIAQAGAPALRIHLIGHSFGSKLLASAILGVGGETRPNRVASYTLIQGAFSHFAFASVDHLRQFQIPATRPGLYADVLASGRVAGYTAATYSAQDLPNTVFYPLGAAIAQDFLALRTDPQTGSTLVAVLPPRPGDSALAGPPRPPPAPGVVEVPKYGALGANGILGPTASFLKLTRGFQGSSLPPAAGAVLNVQAEDVITGHSAFLTPEVYALLWDVVLGSR